MQFNSYTFLIFAIGVFGLYYVLPHRPQNIMLLVASYVFYGTWDYRFLALILASTAVDYLAGIGLSRTDDALRRKWLVAGSCLFNLGILGFFKYCNFFVDSAQDMLAWFGIGQTFSHSLNIVLPVGISFYTFQTMSYTIDVYRRKLEPTRNFLNYALFVSFFPQLVAGPIERASHLLPQIERRRRVNRRFMGEGAWLITLGFFKKCVVADNLAIVVGDAFGRGTPESGLTCLLATYAFAFQIYGDFSGYSDIARGLARLMGIDVMQNFRRPYLATSPRDFWRRWHISLSSWIRDYIYIPLGGSRISNTHTYRNTLVAMTLGGLWHGAAWTFVIWGIYHGLVLAGQRRVANAAAQIRVPRILSTAVSRLLTFHLVCLGWLVFRAQGVGQVGTFVGRIFRNMAVDVQSADLVTYLILFVAPLLVLEAWTRNRDNPAEMPGWRFGLGPIAVWGLWFAIILFTPPQGATFIYFQF